MSCGCSSGGSRWVAGPEASLGLSGVPVVINSTAHWLRRLLWALVLALSLSWLIFLLRGSTIKLINKSVEDIVMIKRGVDVPFPAVTVCTYQRYNPERVSQLLQDGIAVTDWDPSKDITHYKLLRWEELNFDEFVERASFNWSELVANCTVFEGPCEELGTITSSVSHTEGACNTLRLKEPVQGTWMEPQVDLRLTLPKWNNSQGLEEWIVFLHPASLMFNGASYYTGLLNIIPILPATETWIRLKRRQTVYINTEERPCTDNTDWKEILSCASECILLKSASTMEGNNATSQNAHSQDKICQLPWLPDKFGHGPCTTYKDLESALGVNPAYATMTEKDAFAAFKGCRCPYFCSDVRYLEQTPDRIPMLNPGGSRDATLKLWISVDQEVYTETWSYNLSQFVAECGGNIGLFLGASLLSLVEILDMATFWVVRKAVSAAEKARVEVTPWEKMPPGFGRS